VIWYRYGAIDSRASGDSPGKRFAIALRTIPGPPGPMSLTIPDDGISCSAGAGQAAVGSAPAAFTLRSVATTPQRTERFPHEATATMMHDGRRGGEGSGRGQTCFACARPNPPASWAPQRATRGLTEPHAPGAAARMQQRGSHPYCGSSIMHPQPSSRSAQRVATSPVARKDKSMQTKVAAHAAEALR
jgi:hypothetical protein